MKKSLKGKDRDSTTRLFVELFANVNKDTGILCLASKTSAMTEKRERVKLEWS